MMFALDDFTEYNGATLLVPNSHLARTDGWAGVEDGQSGDLVSEAARRARKGQAAVLEGKWMAPDRPAATSASQRSQIRPANGRPDPIQALMPAGSIMFYRGSLLHGGGANSTALPRLGVIMEFCTGW